MSEETLSQEQRQSLENATERARGILQAGRVASFNGWTIGTFAAITILFGLANPVTLMLGVGMAVVARNEFRGRARVRRFEPEGARMLGWNQVGLMVLIVAYCVWSLLRTTGATPDPQLQELQRMAGVDTDLIRDLTVLVYQAVIAVTVIFQGLNARYYFRRERMIVGWLAETDPWVVDVQRSVAGH